MENSIIRSRPARRASEGVPTWLTIIVVLVGAVAVFFVVFLADFVFGFGVFASGNIAGDFFGGPRWSGVMDARSTGMPAVYSNETPTPGGSQIVCEDSDNGKNLGVMGECKDWIGTNKDYCWDNSSLVEFQCAAGKCVRNIYNCLNYNYTACESGACVAKDLPDLTIISLTVYGNDTNVTNQTAILTAIVENIGDGFAVQSALRFNLSGVGFKTKTTKALAPGWIDTLIAVYDDLDEGDYVAEAFADASKLVHESDENNNKKEIYFKIGT